MATLTVRKKSKLKAWTTRLIGTIGVLGLLAFCTSCGESPGYGFTVSGIVTGMAGSGLVLQNNGGSDLSISANGTFNFPGSQNVGSVYHVTIKTSPVGLYQVCTVSNGDGVISNAPVTNITVNCVKPPARFATDPTNNFSYVVNTASGKISAYTIDQTNGTLTLPKTVDAGTNPFSITVATVASSNYAYVPNKGSDNISVYKIESDGSLTPLQTVFTGTNTNPVSVTVATVASSNYAYVPNIGSNYISVYKIESDGSLTSQGTVDAGTNPSSITIFYETINEAGDKTGKFAYVSNTTSGTVSVYTIDQTTGALTPQGTDIATGANPSSVVIDPTGRFAYVANTGANTISMYSIDTTTGTTAGALTAGIALNSGSNPIEFVMTGNLAYVPNFRSNTISVYTIDQTTGTGALAAVQAIAAGTNPYSVAIAEINTTIDGVDTTNIFVYAVNYTSNDISVYKVDPSTGALTAGTTVAAGTNPCSITIEKIASSSVYVAYVLNAGSNDISVYTIDQTTGALTKQQ